MVTSRCCIYWFAISLRLVLGVAGALLPAVFAAAPAAAQDNNTVQPRGVAVPGFWDPRRRPERPDLSRLQTIRFLTEMDYPPFDYAGPDGNPAGFNVDLARLICDEIKVDLHHPGAPLRHAARRAQRQSRRRGDRLDRADGGDAPARRFHRSLLPHAGALRGAHRQPRSATCCRNCSRARRSRSSPAPRTKPISRRCSPRPRCGPIPTPTPRARRCATGDVDLLFGDGIALAFWLNGTDSGGCCAFRGGPFLESRFFGEGVGIAVKRGNDLLRQALNWALFRQWEKGSFTDLWLRYFPISPF